MFPCEFVKVRRFAAVLCAAHALLLLLTGCMSPKAPIGDTPGDIAKAGRLSVTTYGPDQQTVVDRQTGGFELLTNQQRTTYAILSPLGQTIANIRLTEQEATITTANQQRFIAQGAGADQRVTREALGWPLPLSGLAMVLSSELHSEGKTWNLANGWQAETLESVANKPKKLRLSWSYSANIDSERLFTEQTKTSFPELGRIAVLIVINE